MARRIPTNGNVIGAIASKTNTYIGSKETFLDNNAKLIPSDETTMALTNMNWIAGHHTVSNLEALYAIPDFILSQECYADQIGNGADAVGQLWYVEDENRTYQLVNWKKRRTSYGWSLTNLQSVTGPDGKIVVSYFNTNSNDYIKAYGDIKEKSTDWITSVTMYGDGTYTYTTDGIHLNKTTSTYTYSIDDSTSTFNVIDEIKYDPSKDAPHQISYNVKTVKVLSQKHHGGTFEGDFLTSATLSSIGTLTGTNGKFTNETINNTKFVVPKTLESINNIKYLDTSKKVSQFIVEDKVSYISCPTILSYAYIDSTGKLFTTYAIPRNWLHDKINTYNDANKVWFTYYKNGGSYIGYFPIATVKGKDLNSYEYTAGIINDDLMKRYESKINDISDSYNNLSSYVSSSYGYLNNYIGETVTYILNKSDEDNSYIKKFIDNNVLIESLQAYSGPASTYIGYDIGNKFYVTYMKPAAANNQGPLSAYTYNYFDNHVTDIENRLSAREVTKSLQSPSPKVTWTVYKADGTTQVGNKIQDKFEISVERGCYVQADDISITWPKGTQYMVPLSTTGSWGTNLSIISSDDSKAIYFTSTTENKSWTKTQVTSNADTGIWQSLTGITTYGASTLITKQNSVGEWVLQRKNATNTSKTTSPTEFKVNVTQPINYWYGFITQDPSKWVAGSNITDLLINTLEKTTNNSKSCVTKGTKGDSPITIVNNSPILLNNTTPGSPGYFIYIYRTEYKKLSSAVLNNANDVTASFAFSQQKKVKIASRTNGYVQEYWVLWSSGVNSINWPTKFDLK